MRKLIAVLALAAGILAILAWPGAADEIWAEVDGHTVRLFHWQATYNCGDLVLADVAAAGDRLVFTEIADHVMPADCYCDFDLDFTFVVLESGDFVLEVWYPHLGWGEYELLAEIPIHIEGPSVTPSEVQVLQSACGGWGPTAVPPSPGPEPSVWSAVKALYR
jgi:hypothetical protein